MKRYLLLFALLAPVTACSESKPEHAATTHDSEPADTEAEAGDVVYVGTTTDEALERLLDAKPEDVASEQLAFVSPAQDETLSSAAPVTFAVRSAGKKSGLNGTVPARRALPAEPSQLQRATHWLQRVGHWLQPINVAYAHGSPFNGAGYFFNVTDAKGKAQLQVFADVTSYTPTVAAWAELAAAAQPLTLTVTHAFFEDNGIPEGGGPFVGAQVEFRIE